MKRPDATLTNNTKLAKGAKIQKIYPMLLQQGYGGAIDIATAIALVSHFYAVMRH